MNLPTYQRLIMLRQQYSEHPGTTSPLALLISGLCTIYAIGLIALVAMQFIS